MSKKTKISIGLVIVILLVFAFAKFFGAQRGVLEVETRKAARRSIVETVSASGKVQPGVEVKIISQVSGQLISLSVKEGDAVKSGHLLARVNPDLYESALKRAVAALNTARSNSESAKSRQIQAEAQFKVAESNYLRNVKLFEQGAISQMDMDNSASTYHVAKAEVSSAMQSVNAAAFAILSAEAGKKEATDNLGRTYIYAPRDGTVTALKVEEGDVVTGTGMMSGDELMRISDMDRMEVDVEVNESDIVRVHLGDTVSIEVDAYRDHLFKGLVREIGNTALNAMGVGLTADQVTNFSVKIEILKDSYAGLIDQQYPGEDPLKPGMSATVDIETDRVIEAISIPISAVTSREDTATYASLKEKLAAQKNGRTDLNTEALTCVFIYENGKARLQPVVSGVQDNKYIEILSGINLDDEIISGPYDAVSRILSQGMRVKKTED